MTDLLDALGARGGVVCCVGAGGKKSTLYHLAATHPGRVLITATAHTEHFPRSLQATIILDDGPILADRVAAARQCRVCAVARPCELPGRHLGLTYSQLADVRAVGSFDLCVVKADGARNRIMKAPAPHEPAIPPGTDTVLPICSARAIGMALSERIAHRPERVAEATGLTPGDIVRPVHLGRLLASPIGALKGVGTARVVPVINMVDDHDLERLAVCAAEEALGLTTRYDYVVLTSFKAASPLVRIVRR